MLFLRIFAKRVRMRPFNNQIIGMKQICFVALSAMFATSAFALDATVAGEMETMVSSHKNMVQVAAKGESRATSLITAPKGRTVVTEYSGQGWYQGMQYLTAGKMEGISDIVWDDDNNKVYIHTPIGAFIDGYVVGDVSADKTKITVQLPQPITYASAPNGINYPMYLSVMKKTTDPTQAVIDPNAGFSYYPVADEENVVEYSISETEEGTVISMTSPYLRNFERDSQNYIVWPEEYLSTYVTAPKSIFWTLEAGESDTEINEWFNYGNINQTLSPLPDDVVRYDIPANLNWETNWAIIGKNPMNSLCKVAFEGDKIYIGDLIEETDMVLVGTISGDEITFKNNQMLGYDDYSGTYMFLQGVTIDEGTDELGYYCRYTLTGANMVFSWDKDAQTLTFQGTNQGMLLNYGMKKAQWYYGIYKEPVIKAQSDASLCIAPPVPKISQYFPATATKPIIVMAVFPREAENGALLSYDDMAFRLFLDGEVMTFNTSDYNLSADMTEIPCVFRSTGISSRGREATINLFEDGMESITIQTINNAPDGKQYFSDLHTYQLGPDGILNPDGVIEEFVGLQTITAVSAEKAVRYYDIQGRPVANPQAGQLLIKVATLDNGTVIATKVIR